MGATNIGFTIAKKASAGEINLQFIKQQAYDREENGSRDGYSGDFQTVRYVDHHTDQIFDSYNEAYDYCLKHAKKWDSAVAVYYKEIGRITLNAKATKLKETTTQLNNELREFNLKNASPLKGFKTCSCCKSKINFDHNIQTYYCMVCRNDMRPKSVTKKVLRLTKKIEETNEKYNAELTKIKSNLAKKTKNIHTLVAGWGAC